MWYDVAVLSVSLSMQRFARLLVIFLPYIIVFVGSLSVPHDPDLGWHLKYGEYFFSHGHILRENTFSQMMPQYHWVNSSWLTDLVSYATFSKLGFLGLSLLSAVTVTLTFFFFSRWASLTTWEELIIFPFLLFLMDPLVSISFRGQLLSLLFLGIQFFLLRLYEGTRQHRWLIFIPLLFIIWSNVHGQFFMGLALLGVWIVTRLVFPIANLPRWNFVKIATILMITSLCAVLVNPFGIGLYREAVTHVRNKDLQFVAEYLPINEGSSIWASHFIVTGIFVMGVAFAFFSGSLKKIFPDIGIIGLLYFLSFLVRRYSWPFYLFTPILIKPIVTLLKPPSDRLMRKAILVIGIGILSVVVVLKMPFSQFTKITWNEYCALAGCSPKAAETLQNLHSDKKLYSLYDWGGWIIWNYPAIKPTIDGRMHLWRDEKGYSAFEDYYAYEQNKRDIDRSDYDIIFISTKKSIFGHMEELTRMGRWRLVYKDKFAAIYERTLK